MCSLAQSCIPYEAESIMPMPPVSITSAAILLNDRVVRFSFRSILFIAAPEEDAIDLSGCWQKSFPCCTGCHHDQPPPAEYNAMAHNIFYDM